MTRFSEIDARLRDASRVETIRAERDSKLERQFAPAKERARKNAERMNNLKGHLAPW